jgi:ATP-binding cassette subfamily B protein
MSLDHYTIQTYWKTTCQYPTLLGFLIFFSILTQLMVLGHPLILGKALNLLAEGNSDFNDFIPLLTGFIVLEVACLFSYYLLDIFLWRLGIKVLAQLDTKVFEHLGSQSEQFHNDNFAGSLVADTSKLTLGFRRFMDNVFYSLFPTGITVLGICIFLLFYSPLISLTFFVFSISYIYFTLCLRRRELSAGETESQDQSRKTAQLADSMSNIYTVRGFGRQAWEENLFKTYIQNHASSTFRLMKIVLRIDLIVGVIPRLASFIVIILAVCSVILWEAEVGLILIVVAYMSRLSDQLRTTQGAFKDVNRVLSEARSMSQILQTEPSIQDPSNPKNFSVSLGKIEFDRIKFTYNPTSSLFEDFSLLIQPGQKVGLVGVSGSGKTTLTKLLLRFVNLESGMIRIDEQDISQVSQVDLREAITYVPQEPLLFHRSIADNIRYGKLDATQEEIKQAACLARADEFIHKLSAGYKTVVGERGAKLSGGQRQRIAIARAILKNTPVVILDEATSALDSHSEVLIQEALYDLMQGHTSIVIAHRLSTIAYLDRILVLQDGLIVEDGSHTQLLGLRGEYWRLWTHQSGGFIQE